MEGHEAANLLELFRYIARDIRQAVKFDASSQQVRLMERLQACGPLKMTEIAKEFGITLGAVTALADRMSAVGLVQRSHSEEDRRVVHLVLTPQGRALIEILPQARESVFMRYFSRLSENEVHELGRLCRKMLDGQSATSE